MDFSELVTFVATHLLIDVIQDEQVRFHVKQNSEGRIKSPSFTPNPRCSKMWNDDCESSYI